MMMTRNQEQVKKIKTRMFLTNFTTAKIKKKIFLDPSLTNFFIPQSSGIQNCYAKDLQGVCKHV